MWTQLWASWTLPLAWGFTYRRSVVDAVGVPRRPLHHGDRRRCTTRRDTSPSCRWSSGPSSSRRTCGAGSRAPWRSERRRCWRRPGSSSRCCNSPTGRRATRCWEAPRSRTATAPARCCRWLFTGHLYDDGALARRHDPAGRRPRGLHRALAHVGGRPCPRGHLGGHARHVVRADHVRIALRRPPGEQRHLHPPLRDGRAALRHSARRRSASSSSASSSSAPCRCSSRPNTAAGPPGRPGGALSRGCASLALLIVLAPGLERPGHLRRPQRDQHRTPGRRRRRARPADRPAAGLCAGPPEGPRLRRLADELGTGLHRRCRAGVQVPGEQGHRRGRLHAAHRLADDGPRVLLRRDQPGRLPALRHRLHHHARHHGGPGGGRQGRLLGRRTACGRCRTPATSTSTTRPAC